MVTGWRRAFCTSIPKDRETKVLTEKHQQQHCESTSQSPRISSKFGFLSNPSTPRLQSQPVASPRLRCRSSFATTTTPTSSVPNSPKLQCKTSTAQKKSTTPRLFQLSNTPSSPKSSPSSFSLLKASLRLSKSQSRCGLCLQSVKSGQGAAIFTAECSHPFHFNCISSHVKKNQLLVCPVCATNWKQLPFLATHQNQKKAPENVASSKTSKCLRVYNDDEPLHMSPTCGARFNPIPESDENEEDENGSVDEFQGFVVNPAPWPPSPISIRPRRGHESNGVEVKLLPEATAVVAVGKSNETYAVVLKVKAPPLPPPTPLQNKGLRAPIDLVTVVDVSGSGPKLEMMKQAMRLLISSSSASLSDTDRLSIVAFSATASKRLLPLTRMTTIGRRSARKIVDALGSITIAQPPSVNVDALKKAAKVLQDRRHRNPVSTIVLLSSDGGSHRSSPVVSSTRLAHSEIPIHSIEFSDNPHVLHHEYDNAFAKCVRGLLTVVLQDLRLQLGFFSGSAPAEVAAVYSLTGRPTALGAGSVRLGDLHAEEEREFLVELKIPTSSTGSHSRPHHVLSVRSSYRDPSSQVYCKEQVLPIPRPQAVRSSAPEIRRLRNLHVTTRAVAESRRMINENNDLSGAHHMLSSARALLLQSSSSSADEYLRGLEVELADLHRRRERQMQTQRQRASANVRESNRVDDKPEPLTPTSAWRAAERLAKVAIMRKSMNRVSDLHGFENARF